jgi:MFS superfamily sulfate permease-like transporter
LIQLILGFAKAGSISNYFLQMLSKECCGIGIIIILKQLPHAFGYDNDFEGDQAFYKMTELILLLHSYSLVICWQVLL